MAARTNRYTQPDCNAAGNCSHTAANCSPNRPVFADSHGDRRHVDAKTDIYPGTYAHVDGNSYAHVAHVDSNSYAHVDSNSYTHVDAHIGTCISERAAGRNRQARIDSNSGDPNCGQARPRPQLHSAPRSSAGPPVPDTLRIGLVDLRRPHRPDPARQRRPPGTRAIQRALAGRPSTGPVQIQPAARRVARQPIVISTTYANGKAYVFSIFTGGRTAHWNW